MKILLTGGAGFIGQHLGRRLLGCGHEVHILDVCPPQRLDADNGRLSSHFGSVLDTTLVDELVAGADFVVHLAGIAEPMQYGLRPKVTMDVNLQGSLNVIRSASHYCRPILFASTSEIYGLNPDVPWAEDAARVLGPVQDSRWCYSAAKNAVEHYLHACRQEEGLDFVIVRLFNVYGPGLQGRVVSNFIERALAGESLEIHGDGSQIRCFTYIDDVVEALCRIIDTPHHGGTYNIGNPTPVTVLELARTILELTGSSSPIQFVPYCNVYPGFADIPNRVPRIDSISQAFGWRPTTDLRAGLMATLKGHPSPAAADRADRRPPPAIASVEAASA